MRLVTDPGDNKDARPALVLFDLGGVLVHVGGVQHMRDLAGIDSDEEVWERWLTCEWVRRFERGRCDAEEFATGIVADWRLPITPTEFAENFRGWATGHMPGAPELVAEVRATTPVGCLSNSNALQWDAHHALGVGDWFDHVFLSHELDLIKPDAEVFDHVASALGLAPADILFLDDNALNVDAAIAAGFDARLTKGVDQARSVLVDAGVVSP